MISQRGRREQDRASTGRKGTKEEAGASRRIQERAGWSQHQHEWGRRESRWGWQHQRGSLNNVLTTDDMGRMQIYFEKY